MLVQLVLFLIISAGGVLCCSVWDRKYEEILPLTICSIVLTLFLCGLVNLLKPGVYLVIAVCIGMYAFSGYWIVSKKKWKEFAKNFFTPGFIVFVILFLALTVINRAKPLHAWDEFSHWGTVVKSMAINDKLGTADPYLPYANYPPGMALFQYFVQRIYIFFNPGVVINEWRLYFAYQIFFLSLLMPAYKNVTFKKPVVIITAGLAVVFAPAFIFSTIYDWIYIDPFLGVVSGAGLTILFINSVKDKFDYLNVLFCISILVLAKDAGILFAIFLLVAFLAEQLFFCENNLLEKKIPNKTQWMMIVFGIAAVGVPKLLWELSINMNNSVRAFSKTKFDFGELIRIIIGQSKDTYRAKVPKIFFKGLFEYSIPVGDTGIKITFFVLALLMIACIYGIYLIYKNIEPKSSGKRKMMFWVITAQLFVYIYGLCITYMFKFSETEAISLASFKRYILIVILSVWLVAVFSILDILKKNNKFQNAVAIGLSCVLIVCTPWVTNNAGTELLDIITRDRVIANKKYRKPLDEFQQKVDSILKGKEGQSVAVVIQVEEYAYTPEPFIYIFNEYKLKVKIYYKLGNQNKMSVEEWHNQVVNECDYVAIFKLDDFFIKTYSVAFANPKEIKEGEIYKVNKDTGLLELCK